MRLTSLTALLASAAIIAACSQDQATPESSAPTETAPAEAAPDTAPISYAATGWTAKTLPEIADALNAGEVTSEALVGAYLDRIDRIDFNGPTLQSVLSTNPNALDDAKASDARRAAGEALGPLDGVPILLKDNIESKDPIATTAGALALKDNVTGRDAPLVAGLRAQGAVILGKTNLSQWANFRSGSSISGWSALGGQVRNPHMLDRNPCGSSSGSGAAASASLAAGTVGTETNGSIICPANASGIVGFKPTVGLVSQQYIIPISSSQDTAGPMTKTVKGAAIMLEAMATGAAKTDYVAALDEDAFAGARIGVMNFTRNDNADINAAFDQAIADMEAAGAQIVAIDDFEMSIDGFWSEAGKVLDYEFKATINEYLSNAAPAVETRDLDALIAFNEEHADIELALFDQSQFLDSSKLGDLDDPAYLKALESAQAATREDGIDKLMADYNVDMLISPSGVLAPRAEPINGDTWPRWAGGGYLAAIAGYPHASVPMGLVHGLPINVSFIAGKDEDAKVLSFAYAYEQATGHRIDPAYLANAEERPEVKAAMSRK